MFIYAKFHQAKCSGSWVIVYKQRKQNCVYVENNTAVASAGSNNKQLNWTRNRRPSNQYTTMTYFANYSITSFTWCLGWLQKTRYRACRWMNDWCRTVSWLRWLQEVDLAKSVDRDKCSVSSSLRRANTIIFHRPCCLWLNLPQLTTRDTTVYRQWHTQSDSRNDFFWYIHGGPKNCAKFFLQ